MSKGTGLLGQPRLRDNNSIMILKNSEKVICSFCKLSRRLYLKKEVSFFDIAIMFAITALLAFAIWDGLDLRSLLIFTTLAFSLQVFLRVRYRESIKCPHCGFDPLVYKKNPDRAAQQVKAFLANRKDNPKFLLKPKPQIEPIYLSREQMDQLGIGNGIIEQPVNAAPLSKEF